MLSAGSGAAIFASHEIGNCTARESMPRTRSERLTLNGCRARAESKLEFSSAPTVIMDLGPESVHLRRRNPVRPCIAFLSRRHSPFKSRNSENLCPCELDQRVRIRSSEVEPWKGNGATGKAGCVQLPPARNPWPFAYIKIGHIRWSYGQELLRRTQRLGANRNLRAAVQNRNPYRDSPGI